MPSLVGSEMCIAARKGAGPYIGKSSPGARAGKIRIDMTGGTEGPKKMIASLADAGVGTIIQMLTGQELRDEADKHNSHAVTAVETAHLYDARAYLARNTLLKDDEVGPALAALEVPYLAGLDALIVADLGFAGHVREAYPALPL